MQHFDMSYLSRRKQNKYVALSFGLQHSTGSILSQSRNGVLQAVGQRGSGVGGWGIAHLMSAVSFIIVLLTVT